MPPPAEGFASRLFLGPALRTQPDRRLVTLVREGYEAAFEEIVRRYGRPLSRYAASIVGGRSEDVTQDAFSKALLALRRDDAEIELRPWLFRIVRNTALNDLRDSPPSPEILAEAIVGGGNPAEELERREELADLMKRLQALPEPQRAAIVMRELEGLGHEEIAAALGLTGGGARQAIYRARQALRDGAGMLVPLPLLQALLAGGGSGVAETAGAAGMSAAGVGGAAGAGIALKATAATVLVAGAVGAGVALNDNPRSGDAKAAPTRVSQTEASQAAAPAAAQDTSSSRGEGEGAGEGRHGRGSGEAEPGDDHGGHGGAEPGDDHGGETELVDDRRGHGGRGEAEPGDDHAGHDGSSGRHGGDSGPGGDDRSDSSGGSGHGSGSDDSGSGHGGDSGSGHSGSGSGHDSGSGGSGSSGSGGGGSGSSGSSGGGGSGPSDQPAVEDDSGGSSSGSGDDSGSDSGSGSGSSGGDSDSASSTSPEISP
jgi:RNA polymerase sigma factor (sigma-70 family)